VSRRVLALAAAVSGAFGVVLAEWAAGGVVAFLLPLLTVAVGAVVAVVVLTVREDRRRNDLLNRAWQARQPTRERELRRQAMARARRRVSEGADR
jgi:hypothetical protein